MVAPCDPIITGPRRAALGSDAAASLITAIAFGTCQNKNTLIVTPHQRVESCEDPARRDFWTGMLLAVIAAAIHRLMIPRLYPFNTGEPDAVRRVKSKCFRWQALIACAVEI
jgi:hypothetical protein